MQANQDPSYDLSSAWNSLREHCNPVPEVDQLRAKLLELQAKHTELQQEFEREQRDAIRFLAAIVFQVAGYPALSPELLEESVESAIAQAVESGAPDAEAKAEGFDAARRYGKDHGGEIFVSRQSLDLAPLLVVERADTEDGMTVRVLTVADLAERQAAEGVPVDERLKLVPNTPVLAKVPNAAQRLIRGLMGR